MTKPQDKEQEQVVFLIVLHGLLCRGESSLYWKDDGYVIKQAKNMTHDVMETLRRL